MIKTIKRKILPLILAGGLLLGSNTANAEDKKESSPKVNASITWLLTDQHRGINRAELLIRDLPFNLDIYTILEDYGGSYFNGDSYFNKSRIQSLPLETEILGLSFGLGIVAQHKISSFFDSYSQIGIVGRLQGSPAEGLFGKIDLRYFPKERDLDAYMFLDMKNFYFDVLAGYNIDSENAFLILGVDYKLHKNFSVGLEASLSGQGKLKKDYVGIRAKLNF
jgi:hypothetical protein